MSDNAISAETRVLDSQPTVCARTTTTKSALGELFARYAPAVFAAVGAAGAVPAGAMYGRYFIFSDEVVDVEIGIPVASPAVGLRLVTELAPGEVGAGKLPAGPAAVTTHWGHYHGLAATYRRLHEWMEANGLEPSEGPWESYVDDPGDMSDMSSVRTDVFWPAG